MNSNNRLYSTDTSINLSDFSDFGESYENEECMICLEPLNNEIAEISCSHKYHYKCIEKWIKTNNNILRACCICENNTEIVNILNFDSSINQNNLNKNKKNIDKNENNINQNNYLFGCCNIL